MSSFYDIIDLANETGDRIIVHDRYGESDVAVVPLREYRRLVRKETGMFSSVADLSGDELIEKINRELSAWKAQQEADIFDERGGIMEQELAENPPEDPFAEDFTHEPSWHRIGDLLKEQEDTKIVTEDKTPVFSPASPVSELPTNLIVADSPVYKPIPQNPDMAEAPLKLDDEDEPVFYEEPV